VEWAGCTKSRPKYAPKIKSPRISIRGLFLCHVRSPFRVYDSAAALSGISSLASAEILLGRNFFRLQNHSTIPPKLPSLPSSKTPESRRRVGIAVRTFLPRSNQPHAFRESFRSRRCLSFGPRNCGREKGAVRGSKPTSRMTWPVARFASSSVGKRTSPVLWFTVAVIHMMFITTGRFSVRM